MTNFQLNKLLYDLLNSLPQPARVCDVRGAVLSENQAARGLDWPRAGAEGVQTRPVGETWFLQQFSPAPTRTSDLNAASTAGAALSSGEHTASVPSHLPDINLLVRGIAHEIRNPLSSIMTAISLIQDDADLSEETAMLLGVIKKESLRMNSILTEFSHYVQPTVPSREDFDVAQVARQVVARLGRDGALHGGLEVRDELPSRLMAHADATQTDEVLRQIIINAIEAMPETGTLLLTSPQPSSAVVLHVQDSGPGFTSEALERAFQPFYSRKSQGTGLGLSIARATVEAVGGRIHIENVFAPSANGSAAPAGSAALAGARVMVELPPTTPTS